MNWWAMGGVWMYAVLGMLILCLGGGFISVLMAISAIFVPVMKTVTRIAAVLLFLGSLLPSAVGGVGWIVGRMQVSAAIENVSPEQQEQIRAVGNAEAMVPLQFGLSSTLCSLMPMALSLVILVLAPSGKREDDDEQ